MTRSQVSKARQQGCCEPLLGGDSPPMRKRAPSHERESRAEGSAPRDRISKTGGACSHHASFQGPDLHIEVPSICDMPQDISVTVHQQY